MINSQATLEPLFLEEQALLLESKLIETRLKEIALIKEQLYCNNDKWTKSNYSLVLQEKRIETRPYKDFILEQGFKLENIPSKINISKKYIIVKK